MEITLQQLAKVINANIIKGNPQTLAKTVDTAITDSRSLVFAERTVFFALHGTTGRDGHTFIADLYERGVRAFVVDPQTTLPAALGDDCVVLAPNGLDMSRPYCPGCSNTSVEDVGTRHVASAFKAGIVADALTLSGAYMRSLLKPDAQVIAITGSRGKTTVKEMLATAIAPHKPTCRSPRSYNSTVGVPLSLWHLQPDTEVAIIEAGISRSGEMANLAQAIKPNIGIFTDLTDEHAEGFADIRAKAREKALLFSDCTVIFHTTANPIIGEELAAMYPDTEIIACASYEDIVSRVAAMLGIDNISTTPRIESRIDITESDTNTLTLAYDRYTCDLDGISTALDTVRRRTATNRQLAVALGDLPASERADGYAQLARILAAYHTVAVYTMGADIAAHAQAFTAQGIAVHDVSTLTAETPKNTTVYINSSDKAQAYSLYTSLCSRRNITRLEVNLDSLAYNFHHYRSLLPAQTGLVAMIKASAYGCGDIEIARTVQNIGADMVAVAVVDEGVALRRGGITLPIIVLDPWCENLGAIFANRLQPTLINADPAMLQTLEAHADACGVTTIDVHIKLDTGMHRVGLHEDEIDAFGALLDQHPRIRVQSMFSHLATADCLDLDAYTHQQLEAFSRMTARLQSHIGYPVRRHILNTAGITRFGHSHVYELARLGIGLYGLSPLDSADAAQLKPVARLVTSIINIAHYPAGATVGYGCHGVLTRPSVIATLPIGYADGIDRHLGNGGAKFAVNGHMCPTVGNICMDLCMIDITDIADTARVGDEVEIFGPQAPITNISDALDTIHYEVLARVSPRVRRVYFRE